MVTPTWTMRLATHAMDLDASGHDAAPSWKPAVRVATTASITIATALNAGDTIDGITLAAGDRVLVKDQTTGSQNGIYVAGPSPARAEDFDVGADVLGAVVSVVAGTLNAGKQFRLTNTTTPTIGTTTLTFREPLGAVVRNASTAAQAYTTSEVYVTGSALAVPSHLLLSVGAIFRWKCVLTKTAGTGAPVWAIKVGTAGTTADTSRVTFTQVAAGTSDADTGIWDIEAVVRVAGASGVLAGGLRMAHVLAATGFSTLDHNAMFVASSAFDMTVVNLIVGLAFNHGTAGAGNIELVTAELVNN